MDRRLVVDRHEATAARAAQRVPRALTRSNTSRFLGEAAAHRAVGFFWVILSWASV